MDEIISRLREIEKAAASVLEDAQIQKKELAKKQTERVSLLDKEAHLQTEQKLNDLRRELGDKIERELETQKEDLKKMLEDMDRMYEENHSVIAGQLLEKIARQ